MRRLCATRLVLLLGICFCANILLVRVSTAALESGIVHSCIHDTLLSQTLDQLPLTTVALDSQVSDSSKRNTVGVQSVAHVSAVQSTIYHLFNKVDRSASVLIPTTSTRHLKFHLIALLNASCSANGDVVPSYINQGSTVFCTAEDILTPAKHDFVLRATQIAMNRLSAALEAVPLSSIDVPADPCPGFQFEPMTVDDADFVLMLTAAPLSEAGQTIAWGRPCVRESISGAQRPVVGHINFVPPRIDRYGNVIEQAVKITMHEISHALGFISLYNTLNSYVDLNGVRQESGGTVTVYRAGLGKSVQLVRTPRVLAAARRHFGCATLDGVEIEDMGGAGTAGSHWKKRVFYQEALVGVISSASLFYSSVTLAFFEDAGFYKANYFFAEDNYRWGYQRGCEFLTENCRYLYDNKLATEFCFQATSSNKPMCTHDRHSVGYCDINVYSQALLSTYQYYPDTHKGGTLETMDYCPAVLYYNNVDCANPYTVPLMNIYGNEFGPATRCYDSNLISHTLPLLKASPRCLRTSCTNSSSRTPQIVVDIQGQTVRCPADGSAGSADTTELKGLHGFVKCPPASEICPFSRTAGIISPGENPFIPSHIPVPSFPHSSPDESVSCTERVAQCTAAVSEGAALICSSFTTRLQRCIDRSCLRAAKGWVQNRFGVHEGNCWKSIHKVVPHCVDAWVGANAVCHFLKA